MSHSSAQKKKSLLSNSYVELKAIKSQVWQHQITARLSQNMVKRALVSTNIIKLQIMSLAADFVM